MKPVIPTSVARHANVENTRAWKSLKRRQAKMARRHLRDLANGAIYFPDDGGQSVDDALRAIDNVLQTLSIKNWGS